MRGSTEPRKLANDPSICGWVFFADSEHTDGNRQVIPSDTRTLFTIDRLGATNNEEYACSIPSDIWDGTTHTFHPTGRGDTYTLRFDLDLTVTENGNSYLLFQLDIGNSPTQINIVERRIGLDRGQNVTQAVSFAFPIFCLDTFLANGAKFYMEANKNIEVWNKRVFIERNFVAP